MGFNDHSQYPRGIKRITDLTNVEQVISAGPIRVNRIWMLEQAAAAEVVIFGPAGLASEYFRLNAAASTVVNERLEFFAPSLSCKTVDAANVDVTVFHQDLGVPSGATA